MSETAESLEVCPVRCGLAAQRTILTLAQPEYCPPLDPTLFRVIVSDHDLSTSKGTQDARERLDQLKAATLEDQSIVDASGWDPSGTGGADYDSSSAHDNTENGDMSSLNNGVRDLMSSPGSTASGLTGTGTRGSGPSTATSVESLGMDEETALPEEQQIQKLLELFPNLKEHTAKHSLKVCGGNWNRAVDELLNVTFMDGQDGEHKVAFKGIDAFLEDQYAPRKRKTNGKSRKKHRSILETIDTASSRPSSSPSSASPNMWNQSKRDVEFVSEKMRIPYKSAQSIYHNNKVSLQQTLIAVLDSAATKERVGDVANDSHIQLGSVTLCEEYPRLNLEHAIGLVAITHPLMADARECAAIICDPACSESYSGGLSVIPRYAPLELDVDDHSGPQGWQTTAKRGRAPIVASAEDNAAMAASWSEKAGQRFQQASAAHRKGRSNHLMGAAAGYYAQEGHDAARRAREYSGYDADVVVSESSTATLIDLHGVSVKDAVRIAKFRTEAWWNRRKGVRGVDGRIGEINSFIDHLTIVTGRGAHSTGGLGKIGPAVSTMLLRDGWNIAINEGYIHVNGKGRK